MLNKFLYILIYTNLTLFILSYLVSPFRTELDTEILQLNDNGIVVLYLILGINLLFTAIILVFLKSENKLHSYINILVGFMAFIKMIWLIYITNF